MIFTQNGCLLGGNFFSLFSQLRIITKICYADASFSFCFPSRFMGCLLLMSKKEIPFIVAKPLSHFWCHGDRMILLTSSVDSGKQFLPTPSFFLSNLRQNFLVYWLILPYEFYSASFLLVKLTSASLRWFLSDQVCELASLYCCKIFQTVQLEGGNVYIGSVRNVSVHLGSVILGLRWQSTLRKESQGRGGLLTFTSEANTDRQEEIGPNIPFSSDLLPRYAKLRPKPASST